LIPTTERPLSERERAELTRRLDAARDARARSLTTSAGASALVCGALALATLLASNAPNAIVLGFWALLWLFFTLWVGVPSRKLMTHQVAAFETALRADRAREIRIRSERVVEFEEEEDEGACWAFDHGADATLFIVGQEFYEDDDFPNSDFALVEILGEHGSPIDVWTENHGRKLGPERVIPGIVKNTLEIPEHLSVVEARLEDIEDALRRC
jgi:hypothetical protein